MEYRKRCQVCGKIFCYTDKDINNNAGNAALSALSALGGLASILVAEQFFTRPMAIEIVSIMEIRWWTIVNVLTVALEA